MTIFSIEKSLYILYGLALNSSTASLKEIFGLLVIALPKRVAGGHMEVQCVQ